MDPPELPRVYDQDDEVPPDLEWFDHFATVVFWGFGLAILIAVMMILIGCSVFEPPPPTTATPTTTTTTTTTLVPDYITVATSTTTQPPP